MVRWSVSRPILGTPAAIRRASRAQVPARGPRLIDISEPITRHEELAATQRVRANSDKVVAGQLCGGPHDRVLSAPVAYLNPHQETHPVEPAHQCWGRAWLGVRPEGFAVIHAIQHMFDVAVRRQHKRRYTTAGLQPFEVLRRQRVQPRQPVGPGYADHTTVGQVNDAFATGQQPLLTHRVAVVPRHTDIWPSLGHNSGHGSLQHSRSILFFPYACHG